MIYSVWSDRPSFRTVHLEPGFNVILAEKTRESTKKDSRNGLGKSTLFEIIHFCLGGDGKPFKVPLAGWLFGLDLQLGGRRIRVERRVQKAAVVAITGDTTGWPIQPYVDAGGQRLLGVKDWSAVLGTLLFDLPVSNEAFKYKPTFRSLFSYFVRHGRDAFTTPFEHFRKQQQWDKQVNNSFLLGLAWQHASELQTLKDRKKLLTQMKAAAKAGLMSAWLGGALGELEALKVRLEARTRQQEEQLRTFRVHDQYRQIEVDSNRLTEQIHHATNENATDTGLLNLYQASLVEEKEPRPEHVIGMYEEAGVELPATVTRRLEEVLEFHRQIAMHRRQFLQAEIARLESAIVERNTRVGLMIEERAQLLSVLATHAALEEFTKLEQLHGKDVARVEDVGRRIDSLRKFQSGTSELRIEMELLQQRARQAFDELQAPREQAITAFNAITEALYQAPGNLVIDFRDTGFFFDVEIERAGSQGISSMKVFCYDLMLSQLWAERPVGPRLLAHDSPLFDPVDERQKATALELAATESERRGFQYICALNSDAVPREEFSQDFDFDSHVRLTLTDATEDGGLLGIRF